MTGYNAGEGAVDKYRGIPPYAETRGYVKNVKYRYGRLSKNPVLTSAAYSKPVTKPAAVPVTVAKQQEVAKVSPVVMKRQHEAWDVFQEF
ncbi:lytic transglycosylase domain-containing protein [Neisseriaceae bacterium B1]